MKSKNTLPHDKHEIFDNDRIVYPSFKTLGSSPSVASYQLPHIDLGYHVLNSARETLVLLGIVVLETDLQVNGLDELPLLGILGVGEDLTNALVESFLRNFACPGTKDD